MADSSSDSITGPHQPLSFSYPKRPLGRSLYLIDLFKLVGLILGSGCTMMKCRTQYCVISVAKLSMKRNLYLSLGVRILLL